MIWVANLEICWLGLQMMKSVDLGCRFWGPLTWVADSWSRMIWVADVVAYLKVGRLGFQILASVDLALVDLN